MKLKNNSRRKFLKDANSLAMSTGILYGLDNLLSLLMQNSVAHAASSSYEYKYVSFLTSGGPPRWYFDQPLNPKNEGTFVPGGFGTVIRNIKGNWTPVHIGKSVKFGAANIFMPPVWSLKSASSGEAFASLLNDTIMIRGLNMEINAHGVNQQRTIRPFNSTPSISGLVAQNAQKPVTSLGHSGASTSLVYKSPDGSAPVNVNRNNPVPGITSPFTATDMVQYKDLDYSIQQAVSAIDKYAKDQRLPSQGNETTLKNTYDMFARNLSQFTKTYSDLVKKYEAIVDKEISAQFAEVNTDLAKIKPNGGSEYRYGNNNYFSSKDNLSAVIKAADRPSVAHAFAFAEFALTEDLTASLTLDLGINFNRVNGANIPHDQHFIGSISSILFTSLYYRSVLGCMCELRKALKPNGIWDKTVFQFASEFSRTPRSDGSGSDHGFEGGSTTIMSGMIKTPGLIGNIYNTPPSDMIARYSGTYGHAAPFLNDGGKMRAIINDDVVSTVCEMLQIPKIGTKGQSFVKNDQGSVRLLVKDYKNIKRGA
jgi:hypothetical protein